MGESIRRVEIVEQATQEFRAVIRGITAEQLNALVSLDLSLIGMVHSTKVYQRHWLTAPRSCE